MTDPTSIIEQTDDALYWLNTPDTDLFNASEDPTGGKGKNQLPPQFNHRAPKRVLRTHMLVPDHLEPGSVPNLRAVPTCD